jgi:steroid delta-isomerase-like uncharacterized protein
MGIASALQREMFETVEKRDLGRLRDLYHPDYTYTGSDGVERGGAETGAAVAQTYLTAFPDLSFEIRHQYESGGVAVMELTARGTHRAQLEDIPPTGRAVEAAVCNVIEARDGKIYREREYFDRLLIMQQLGVLSR